MAKLVAVSGVARSFAKVIIEANMMRDSGRSFYSWTRRGIQSKMLQDGDLTGIIVLLVGAGHHLMERPIGNHTRSPGKEYQEDPLLGRYHGSRQAMSEANKATLLS